MNHQKEEIKTSAKEKKAKLFVKLKLEDFHIESAYATVKHKCFVVHVSTASRDKAFRDNAICNHNKGTE